jgi:hypothetical protein
MLFLAWWIATIVDLHQDVRAGDIHVVTSVFKGLAPKVPQNI